MMNRRVCGLRVCVCVSRTIALISVHLLRFVLANTSRTHACQGYLDH